MRFEQALARATRQLADAGIEQPGLDARMLMQHASQMTHAALIARMGETVTAETAVAFERDLARRLAGEPVHRIIGEREFYGLAFTVTPAVLDPRSDTEILVGRVIADQAGREGPLQFADVGSGSGAIAVALLVNLPQARCLAIDLSADALAVTRDNAERHGVGERLDAVRGDYLEAAGGPFDFIVSNPPYIRSDEIGGLQREVREHDPRLALDGGADGLDAYRALFAQAPSRLKPSGRLYLEIGADQAEDCRRLAAEAGWKAVEVIIDLAGRERLIVAVHA